MSVQKIRLLTKDLQVENREGGSMIVTINPVHKEDLLHQVLCGDLQLDAFNYILSKYPKPYLHQFFFNDQNFECKDCGSLKHVSCMMATGEICAECSVERQEKGFTKTY